MKSRPPKSTEPKQAYRDVECYWQFNVPKDGLKELYRTDTGEFVEEARMQDHEKQQTLPLEELAAK